MHLADSDTDLPLPSLETLVAGAVGLATTSAAPCPGARIDTAAQRASPAQMSAAP